MRAVKSNVPLASWAAALGKMDATQHNATQNRATQNKAMPKKRDALRIKFILADCPGSASREARKLLILLARKRRDTPTGGFWGKRRGGGDFRGLGFFEG